MPQKSNFSQKIEVTVMARNHGGDPLGSILGPMGSHWVQKMGQNRKKSPCPKIRIFGFPAVIDFSQKIEVTVMAPNHGGDPLGSILGSLGKKNGSKPQKMTMPEIRIFGNPAVILGPMGSHWVQKMGQNRKKLPCPKIRIFGYPAVIDFSQKIKFTVMAPNDGGDPLGSILGSLGPHW